MPNMNFGMNNSNYYPAATPAGYNTYNPAMNNLPQYSIIQVNGKNGVDALQMAPNSKVLLLDETAPIVWLAQTDGAGYKTSTPYSITPYKEVQPEDMFRSLESRIMVLEEKINAQPNFTTNKQSNKQQRNNNSANATE